MALSLSERDQRVIWHPYTPQKYAPDPIPIVKAEGVWLVDEAGNRYIDAISSWWVTIHGHAHPYIAEKIHQQALTLEQVIFAGFTHLPAVELAERLLAILPDNLTKIFYSDNGSTATEVAVKMAIQYWWNRGEKHRTRILALTNSYHGDTFGAMSISERSVFTLAFQDRLFDVVFANTPVTGATMSIRDVNDAHIDQVLNETACVIYEPLIQGAGGMNMYDPGALDAFLTRCRKNEIICIADEVMTGFGRSGKLFASQYCDTVPDIICLSKGITGGTMALGVTACNERIHEAFVDDDRKKTFYHGHSFTANPLACSAALASLELLLQDQCLQNIDLIGQHHASFKSVLDARAGDLNIKNIRHRGTIIAFEVADIAEGYHSGLRDVFTAEALKQGVYLRPLGNTVYLMPPYCITGQELQHVYRVILNILEGLKK